MRLPPIPTGIPANVAEYLRSLSRYVEVVLRPAVPPDVLYISSPDKSVWEIRVDNTGNITSTKVKRG